MAKFDDQIEVTLNRAGMASAMLILAAILILALGVVSGIAIATYDPIGFGIILSAFASAALLYGIAMIINVQGMMLLEVWRQGRRSRSREDAGQAS